MTISLHLPDLDWNDISTKYFHLVNHIQPGPQSWSYFIPHILLPAALLVPPHILSHNGLAMLVFPVILASTIHAVIAMRGPDVISTDTLWWSLYFLVLTDPRKDFKRVTEVAAEARTKEIGNDEEGRSTKAPYDSKLAEWPYPPTIFSRLKWTLTLISERPLTCWKTGRASHDDTVSPPYISQTRSKFVKHVLIILLPAAFLTMPLSLRLHALERQSASWPGTVNVKDSIAEPVTPTLPLHSSITHTLIGLLPAQLLQSLMLGLFLYSFLILLFLPCYLIPPLISLLINPSSGAAHTWSPHLWPRPHFGPFTAVLDSGLRGLWGKWWHQQMRHAVSEPGRWLSNSLGLRRGLVRYGIICTSAFLLSGITHMGLVPPEIKGAWNLRFMIGLFFFMQPIGMLVEMVVVEEILARLEEVILSETKLQTIIIRLLRLCWVLLFMSLPLRFLAVPFEELGYWRIWPPVSFSEQMNSVLSGDWIP